MDKSGNNTPKGTNMQMVSPKAIAWATQTLGGCERDLCCRVALDADKYFKAFTKCRDEKKQSDAQLEQHEQLWTGIVEQLSLLQTVFSRDAQEKEALRAENEGLRGQNILLNAEVFRLKTIIEKCAIVPKSGVVPPNVVKKDPPLALTTKRQSTGGHHDESTSVGRVKRIKESGPTTTAPSVAVVVPPLVANAKQKPMQATKNAKSSSSSSHSNVLEDFWQTVKEHEQGVLHGWTTARALVEHFMITNPPCTVLEQHQNSSVRQNVLRFADSIFAFVHQNNALPPLKIKDHQFFVEK
uniref:Uncharacterized protein n=2 Tax=Globodera rostochiensis TaxID=31243 RepID=A0A914GSR8_GLORO